MLSDAARSSDDELTEDEKGLVDRAAILKRWNVRNKHLLDIGVGPLAIIAARDFKCHVTTIDTSDGALLDAQREAEREGLAREITVEREDATSLTYQDNSFEVVVSYGVLHHIAPKRRMQFILEVYRVAKEIVIIAELNADGFRKIHEFDDFTAVDLTWLERELNTLGDVDKYQGRLMDAYALSFYKKTGTKTPFLKKKATHEIL
jgi:ubiquinone/menaquinone biosynthesis C-methylase UbiE